ncbi:hypothetical protein ACFHWD_06575 [Clostridium sp. MT-14]|jgi:hypothetical protein|uniref:Glutaredoxin n=1 Tax=Clostridium aromativorans TaxID=2836848 RepID=A0ABS8N8A4_9CLOT|nr:MULTISPECIES: hypothetical protein [Clostridium]KAA8676052.1 hypothetical protein F3O63_04055 [Clostridium sp. HV4-5-A1G]MCC9295394.1 hypothetical protein [Clostridium aromativorans]CAB1247354.1 conserved hypothetical protein [Clostridiaceae bacterium BL-3]
MKIKIAVYGNKDSILSGINYCSCKDSSCFKCSNCSNCKSGKNESSSDKLIFRRTYDLYGNLKNFLEISDVAQNIDIKFIELSNLNFSTDDAKVKKVIEQGFTPPITVIDGIIRYYGGISNILVYRDVKELLN